KLVEPLINAGIDVKFESSTPTERKVRDICDRTFARYSTNRRCKYSDYLIEIAASKGMVGCLDLFANTWCSTFIIPIACKYGLERLAIKYLLNKAEVDDSDSCSIVFASQRGLFEYIKLFFDHFPKEKLPKIEDNLYKALDKATIKGHKKIVKLLLKKLMLFTPPARYSYKKPFETLFKVSDLGLNIDLKPLFQKNLRLMEKGIKESKYTGDFNTILENYYCQMMEFGIKSKHEHTVRLALDLLRSRFETLPQSAEALLINQAATHGLNQLIVDFFEDEKKENRAELMNALTPEQEYQDTPLVQACKSGIKSTALLFIILGADVSIRHRNTTALAEAAKQGWTDVVQLILDRLPEDKCKEHIQIKEGEYDTYPLALENACKAGHEEIALMLLQKGGFPEGEEKEIDSGNIISKMTSSGFSNAVSWLIKNYPQIYKNFEYTKMIKAKLLRYSSYKPNDEIMAQLILVGANVEELGGEFIRYLAKNGFNKSLSLALEQLPPKSKKEIIESLSNAGQSALWLACNNGHEESALLLIKAGAGCIPLVDEKETIYDIASDKSLEKVQKTILEQLLICYENGITTYENKQISYPDLFFKSRNLFDKKINDTCLEIPVNEGTQKFFVNSTILSERVEYFRPLFQGNYKDSCLMRSTVVGGDPAAFKVYLRFIYTGRIKSDAITHKNFKKLLFYSNFYYLEKSFNKKLVKALKTWRRQRPECANWL
ncbi:MAG: ankyrin repeat domain-containing protein, partial [Chlamydiota bacterium]